MRATRSARSVSSWPTGAQPATVLHRCRSQAAGLSMPWMTGEAEERPWRAGFRPTTALPRGERGPVERRALRRLAAICLSDVMRVASLPAARFWQQGDTRHGGVRARKPTPGWAVTLGAHQWSVCPANSASWPDPGDPARAHLPCPVDDQLLAELRCFKKPDKYGAPDADSRKAAYFSEDGYVDECQ